MQKGTDMGPGIIHVCITIPPNLLYPVIMIGSASKCYFGSSSTKANDGCVAVAVLKVINLNLNCGSPIPTPNGMVFTWNTVTAGMTWADFFSGLLTMLIEGAIQTALNLFFSWGPIKDFFNGLTGRVFGNIAMSAMSEEGIGLMSKSAQLAMVSGENLLPTAASLLAGSPLGLSAVNVPQAAGAKLSNWWSPAGNASSVLTNPIQNHLNDPAVDEHQCPAH